MTKVYDDGGSDIVAVSDLDIETCDGGFLVLVGSSGCGNSTTIYVNTARRVGHSKLRCGCLRPEFACVVRDGTYCRDSKTEQLDHSTGYD